MVTIAEGKGNNAVLTQHLGPRDGSSPVRHGRGPVADAGIPEFMTRAQGTRTLPADAELLPIRLGALLVSPEHATYCAIPTAQLPKLAAALRGPTELESCPPELMSALEEHAFFGPPRPAEHDPPTVQIQLTNACDLACDYCCTNSGQPRETELTLDDLLPLLPRIRPVLGDDAQVAILGGEPLTVTWATDLAAAVLDEELPLTIFTNGVCLADDDALAQRVAALVERGASLRVSLAGAEPGPCDAVSGAPRFEAVLRGLQRLHEHGGHATVDLMLFPDQVDSVAEHLHALRTRLPPRTPIALGLAFLGGRELGQHVFTTRAALEDALDRVAFEAGETIAAAHRSPVTWRRDACGCALGNHLHLRSDGALFPCFKMEEPAGQLHDGGFEAAVTRLRANPRPASTLDLCRACPLRTLCGGGCRAENQLHTGDPDLPACGPWRVRVMAELLAEDRVSALHWPATQLLAEARERGISAPDSLPLARPSLHLCHP